MYIKMEDNRARTFKELRVGDIFILGGDPFMKIQEVHERFHHPEGGYVYIDYNCVDLSTNKLEYVLDTTDVSYMPSTLIIGKGKGEV